MDVFDSCTFCSSRASSLPEGGLVHSWPGVYQAEAFSVVVFCLVGFCAPILSTPFPSHPISVPSLPYALC